MVININSSELVSSQESAEALDRFPTPLVSLRLGVLLERPIPAKCVVLALRFRFQDSDTVPELTCGYSSRLRSHYQYVPFAPRGGFAQLWPIASSVPIEAVGVQVVPWGSAKETAEAVNAIRRVLVGGVPVNRVGPSYGFLRFARNAKV